MKRILLDTNIVLDVLLDRMPWGMDASAILDAMKSRRFVCCVSALTIVNVFYVARKQVGLARAREIVRACFAAFEILPLDSGTLEDADRLTGSDFEDNVQVSTATAARLDAIVTRDLTGFQSSEILVLSPSQLLERLGSSPDGP